MASTNVSQNEEGRLCPGLCPHYSPHNFEIVAECCGKRYPCRLCHDLVEDDFVTKKDAAHSLDRFTIQRVACKECHTVQTFSTEDGFNGSCKECGIKFVDYVCDVCKTLLVADDYPNHIPAHCDQCGICRLYPIDIPMKHCRGCKVCIIAEHDCKGIEMRGGCPVCMIDMPSSKGVCSKMDCGHFAHTMCIEALIENRNFLCPLCRKQIIEVTIPSESIEVMPPEFANTSSEILCQDCSSRTTVPFHFSVHFCGECGSWNTVVLKVSNFPFVD